MARNPPKLKVDIVPLALNALDEIWDWNARQYNADHADKYVFFLEKETSKLATAYLTGKIVLVRPDYRYLLIKKRAAKSHGHVAIYEILSVRVRVLYYYHTAQDWQGKIARGEW